MAPPPPFKKMAGIEDYQMGDDSVRRVKAAVRVRKGRGFGDSEQEKISYESMEDTGGPGPMR